jgi:hypothetical protein
MTEEEFDDLGITAEDLEGPHVPLENPDDERLLQESVDREMAELEKAILRAFGLTVKRKARSPGHRPPPPEENLMRVAIALLALPFLLFAAKNNERDFPLHVHIVGVDMAQGQRGISGYGSGSTDSNGNYSSHSEVSGGGTYLYHVYTVHIDGDRREFRMTSPAAHIKGGRGLASATLGVSALVTMRRNYWLHIGNYKGSWNKDGSLEIEYRDNNGRARHQPFFIRAESLQESLNGGEFK